MSGWPVTRSVRSVRRCLLACADESQPEYWIEKLDDKAWRPKAIERLNQFYEDALTNAGKDATKPRFLHAMIRVRDIKAAERFYIEGLGMKVLDRFDVELELGGHHNIVSEIESLLVEHHRIGEVGAGWAVTRPPAPRSCSALATARFTA